MSLEFRGASRMHDVGFQGMIEPQMAGKIEVLALLGPLLAALRAVTDPALGTHRPHRLLKDVLPCRSTYSCSSEL